MMDNIVQSPSQTAGYSSSSNRSDGVNPMYEMTHSPVQYGDSGPISLWNLEPKINESPALMVSSGDEPAGADKVKTKLKSVWNNMKFELRKKMGNDLSREAPIWLLGKCYYREFDDDDVCENSHKKTSMFQSGFHQFRDDFHSRIWFTYRCGFVPVKGSTFTSDCGWGCMLRTGQMMLAQGYVLHFLKREWMWESTPDCREDWFREEQIHRRIVQWFGDNHTVTSPLSIHQLVSLSRGAGKKAGDWFGPTSVSHLLKQAVEIGSCSDPFLLEVKIYVAQDCVVYMGDIEKLCNEPPQRRNCLPSVVCRSGNSSQTVPPSHRLVDNIIEGHNSRVQTDNADCSRLDVPWTNVVRQTSSESASSVEDVVDFGVVETTSTWTPVIIIIPLRLGTDEFNPEYIHGLQYLLSFDCCLGIIGGRPKHSLYFIGWQRDRLICLDPHLCQEVVDVFHPQFSLYSYHCRTPRSVSTTRIAPSCAVGFYCRSREQFLQLSQEIKEHINPPMFEFLPGRQQDFVNLGKILEEDVQEVGLDLDTTFITEEIL